jgi:hypothetical protein
MYVRQVIQGSDLTHTYLADPNLLEILTIWHSVDPNPHDKIWPDAWITVLPSSDKGFFSFSFYERGIYLLDVCESSYEVHSV